MEDLFDQLIERLSHLNEIQFKNLFIDGTKIEANANRYSFVWLKSVTKNEAKLHIKIKKLIQEVNDMYLVDYSFDCDYPLSVMESCLLMLQQKVNEKSLEFVYGKGKRKTILQSQVESMEEYLEKQHLYLAYKDTIGIHRSSRSKTDADATFMRMKEDHMKNGQLKPGYNVQIGVEAEYIVHVVIFNAANDVTTLVPFLTSMESRLSKKVEQIIADSGYESEENYVYLKENHQKFFIKPTNYELSKTSKFKAQIGKRENMRYDDDGTKIESAANRDTFVWKKAVNKNYEKLMSKIPDFIYNCEEIFDFKIRYKDVIKIKHLKKLMKKLRKIAKYNKVEFVHGKGKRKSQIQKSIETLESYISRLKMYNNHLFKIGTRNSYSKTDNDATFMRMKEDHMKNGQLKPAYNIQAGIDSSYITWIGAFSNPTDTNTLKSFLNDFEINNNFKYKNIVADAGYESEENYVYLKENHQKFFIKPTNYELSKTSKFKAQIGKRENMRYDEERDTYICLAGRELKAIEVKIRETQTGYQREVTIYEGEDCANCPLRAKCTQATKEGRNKRIEVSKKMISLREESLQNIQSEEGIILRKNRSIQVEGAFGVLKQDYGFRKFLTRGKVHVLVEMLLLCFGYNIKKLHHKIQNERCGQHLHTEKVA